ncbi:metalloendopeptidase [Cytospora paraplurivora]|uniref:Metalloendopeptidase n=1 Tax=Cytospora paraplurivora TaxID=2898453 RepID=A0AAN9U0W0_9PEZI
MIEGLVGSKTATEILVTLAQVTIGFFDMTVHSTSSENLVDLNLPALYNRIWKDVRRLDDVSDLGGGYDWGHGFAIYPHLIGGYAAEFYAHLLLDIAENAEHAENMPPEDMKAEPGRPETTGTASLDG